MTLQRVGIDVPDPRWVLSGQWQHGGFGYWDRISAMRAGIAAVGGVGSPKDTAVQLERRLRGVEEVFRGFARTDSNDLAPYLLNDPDTGAPVFQERMHWTLHRVAQTGAWTAVEAYRGSGKTTQLEVMILDRLAHSQGELIKLISEGSDTAVARVRNVKTMIDGHARLHAVHPQLTRHPDMPWTDQAFTVQRSLIGERNPSLCGFGVDSRGVGGRATVLVGDDATPPESMFSEPVRLGAITNWGNVWMKMLVRSGVVWFFFTPWHSLDLTSKIKASTRFTHLRFAVGGPSGCRSCPENGGAPCTIPFHNPWSPKRLPPSALKLIYEDPAQGGALAYARSHELNPFSSETTLFPPRLFTGPIMRSDLMVGLPWRFWAQFGVTIVFGVDLALGGGATNDWMVIFVLGFDGQGRKYIIDIIRILSSDYKVQLQDIVNAAAKYRPELIYIEGTQFQRVYSDILATTTSLPVRPFYPLGRGKGRRVEGYEKKDLVFGVPSLRIDLENGKTQIPRGSEKSLELTDLLIAELQSFTLTDAGKLEGVGGHDDIAMAFWIANSAARKLGAGYTDDGDEESAPSEAPYPEIGIVAAARKTAKDLGERMEGLEDLGFEGGKNADEILWGVRGIGIATGAGTKVQKAVPGDVGAAADRQARARADRIGKTALAASLVEANVILSGCATKDLQALWNMVVADGGKIPPSARAVAGGVKPQAAGGLAGVQARFGDDIALVVLRDLLRQREEESTLATPYSTIDELSIGNGTDADDEVDDAALWLSRQRGEASFEGEEDDAESDDD